MRAKAKRGEAAELLLPWLREREGEMASLVADLVAVPTENPPGRYYKEFAELFEGRIASIGLRSERLEPSRKDSAVDMVAPCLSVTYGKGERIFYFHGHYDVVPAQSGGQFQPSRKDHFLFGRGACDMKGGIVCMLYAILALRECGVEMGGKIQLVLIPDEEPVGLAVPQGWRSGEFWAEMESACSWQSRPAEWFGMPTGAPFRCAFRSKGKPPTSACNTREKTLSNACTPWSSGFKS